MWLPWICAGYSIGADPRNPRGGSPVRLRSAGYGPGPPTLPFQHNSGLRPESLSVSTENRSIPRKQRGRFLILERLPKYVVDSLENEKQKRRQAQPRTTCCRLGMFHDSRGQWNVERFRLKNTTAGPQSGSGGTEAVCLHSAAENKSFLSLNSYRVTKVCI